VNELDPALLDELRSFTTPSVANGIETFEVRGRHEGFMDASVRCMFPELGPLVGYAATATMRAAQPGESNDRALWAAVHTSPKPCVVVVQDLDEPCGTGSLWGEVNANIHQAFGAAGVVTNGCVRDLDEMRALRFHAFAGSVGVSHAHVHVVEAGVPVRVGRLEVRPGDLIHADQHGVATIPLDIAEALPAAIRELEAAERRVIGMFRAPDFDPDAFTGPAGRVEH
jgi:regulator of RNase E activity RraA